MIVEKVIERLTEKGLPIFWQFYIVVLYFAAISIYFIDSQFWRTYLNIGIHVCVFIGVYAGLAAHRGKSYPRLFIVNGVWLIIIAMLMRSLIHLNVPINIDTAVWTEEAGIVLITIGAYKHMLMFEDAFKLKGFTIDYTLLFFSGTIFFLLISSTALQLIVYEFSSAQQLLVINIVVGLTLLSMSIVHFLLSKSIGLTDMVRVALTFMVITHFGVELWINFGSAENVAKFSSLSWISYHFAGALAIMFIFIEKFSVDFSPIAPSRLGTQFMWIASIIAILTVPFALIVRAIQNAPSLSLLLIVVPSIFLSTIVIWRFVIFITRANQQHQRIKSLIQTNALTGLPNYHGYIEKLARVESRKVLLVCVNIDDFKAINDLYGRNVADKVLKSLAQRLQQIRESELVFHVHIDTFLVVFHLKQSAIQALIESMRRKLGVWDDIEGERIAVPLTFGASYSIKGTSPEKLAKQAEQALKGARRQRVPSQLFKEMDSGNQFLRHELRHILQQALDRRYLPVHVQPIYNLDGGSLKALELLMRVESEEYGLLMPEQFIKKAESYGLLASLTEVSIEMIAKHASCLPDVPININLPPYMMKSPELLNSFIQQFKKNNLDPSKFCVEVTEDGEISVDDLIPAVEALKHRGFKIAMDDFGTGYSTLNRLAVLQVDDVKIDRSLLHTASSGNAAILESAIDLAKNLGVSVVVEGVETVQQLALVKLLGANSVQGFLFSEPLPVELSASIALNSGHIQNIAGK